jgi:hypothetical protein
MNRRIWGLWANIFGTLLLLAAGGFETGKAYIAQGKLPYPWVGWLCYWVGFASLLVGFGLQLSAAYGERRRLPPTPSPLAPRRGPVGEETGGGPPRHTDVEES